MNIIDQTAMYLARSIRKHNPQAASEAILKYALISVLNTVGVIAIVLSVCLFTGHFLDALIALTTYPLLRYFSGGVHLRSSVSCTVISSIVMILVANIHTWIPYHSIGFYMTIAAIMIALLLAPSGISNKISRIDEKYYPILKLIAVLIIASNFYFQSSL